ncbi:LysR family transcriptional regulator [Roseisalinus antarcticus]|uniref:HTH-type transcriptional regulator CysL n=1 Tax=Roseisalinus antarcticus TaxID=254357 RepID=A0A1Y5T043_9RHOB|nr:LysR family transcriptional regulator [Roseisalinus antarcticus]SLN52616.1 HTH-type transcriptional regulator CysL [Roseisalinus antarcticus]
MRHLTDLRTLTAFVTVLREGNVTRAAEMLHLSQPAVTLQLKQLSEACGMELFHRTPKGLSPTHQGALLAVKAEKVLSAMAEFGHAARTLTGGIQGRIRIGTVIDPDFTRLGAFLAELNRAAPGLETELFHSVSGEILARVLRDEIDAGFFLGELDVAARAGDETIASRIHQQLLARFSYFVIAPPGWENRIRGKDWTDLAQLPWIGTQKSSVHNRLLTRIFGDLGVTPRTVARVDQELSMLAMVRSGIGLSLCRDSLALFEKQANGVAVADRVEIGTTLSFITLAERRSDPRVACIFDAMSGVWSENPSPLGA